MKRFIKILLRLSVAMVLLLLLVFISLRFEKVQTYLGQKAANYLSNELHAEITVDKLRFDLWELIELENVLVKDQNADTLLFVNDLKSGVFSFDSENNSVYLQSLTLNEAVFSLITPEGKDENNLQFIVDYFSNSDSTGNDFQLTIDELNISNSRVAIQNLNYKDSLSQVLNSHHLIFNDINSQLTDFKLKGDRIDLISKEFSSTEKSGIAIHNLSGNLTISPSEISAQNSEISLNSSQLKGDFKLTQEDYSALSEYGTNVNHQVAFRETHILLSDLNRLSPSLKLTSDQATVNGTINGTLEKLDFSEFKLQAFESTALEGSFTLSHIENPEAFEIQAPDISVRTTVNELESSILSSFMDEGFKFPPEISHLNSIHYSGQISGKTTDLMLSGAVNSDIGRIDLDVQLNTENEIPFYSGKILTQNLNLKQLVPGEELNHVAADLTFSGSGSDLQNLEGKVSGTINSLGLKDLTLHQLNLDLEAKDGSVSGNISSLDPRALLNLRGSLDYLKTQPRINVLAEINTINLEALGLNYLDLNSISVADLRINGTGNSIDDFDGKVNLINTQLNHSKDSVSQLAQVSLDFNSQAESIDLLSDVIDLSYSGTKDFKQLEKHFQHIALPFSPEIDSVDFSSLAPIKIAGTINDFSQLAGLIPMELSISEGSKFSLLSSQSAADFELTSDLLILNQDKFENIDLSLKEPNGKVEVKGNIETILLANGFVIRNAEVSALQSDLEHFTSHLSWNNGADKTSGKVNFDYDISEEKYNANFTSGVIHLGPITWNLDPGGRFSSHGDDLSFQEINLANGEERIYANGSLNTDENTTLEIENVNLSALNFFTPEGTSELSGFLNGHVEIQNNFSEGTTQSNITIENLKIDDVIVGDVLASGNWNSEKSSFEMDGSLRTGENTPLTFEGSYFPFKDENPLNAQIHTNDLNLSFLSAFIKEQISEFDGSLSGDIEVTGDILKPELNGSLDFDNARIKLDYLNTTYYLNEGVGILPDMFILENIEITDEEGNIAYVVGTVLHENFKEWNYDIGIDIEEEELPNGEVDESRTFLVLNTTETDNDLFFGKGYASGYANISGYKNNLMIEANLKTKSGTLVSLPLGDSEDVVFEDFVSFVKPKEDAVSVAKPAFNKDMNLQINLEIDVNEDAEFQMVFDQVTGDVMKGSGNGHLSLNLNENQEFEMYGNLAVASGSYLFTLQNLINKHFEIKPGGNISWYGDPFLADIDLDAVYKLSAPLYDILGSADEAYKKRIPVELVMELEGKLLNPGIHFEIDLPNADDLTINRVNSVINTEQERNKQAFSLLVLKKFIPTQSTTGTEAHGQLGLAENSSEFLSSQLNNWLSQITDEVDIGINYRPGDEITSQEIALALSTQLFNDKLYISGNFGVTNGSESNPSSLIGDVRVEYLLVEDKIRLLVYNETNNFNINTNNYENSTTQGLGLIYKEEFDNWDEFITEFKLLLKKDKS